MLGLIKLKRIPNFEELIAGSKLLEISKDFKLCMLLSGKDLFLIPLNKNLNDLGTSNHLKDVLWCKLQSENSFDTCQLLLGNSSGLLNLLEVNLHVTDNLLLDCSHSWDLGELLALFPDENLRDDYEILAFVGKEAIFNVQNQNIVVINVSSNQAIELKNQFPVTVTSKALNIKFQNGFIYVLNSNAISISSFNIETGSMTWTVNISNSSDFLVSSDSTFLAAKNSSDRLQLLRVPNSMDPGIPTPRKPIITAFSKLTAGSACKQDKLPLSATSIELKECSVDQFILTEKAVFITASNYDGKFLHVFSKNGQLIGSQKFMSYVYLIKPDGISPPLIFGDDVISIYSSGSSTTSFVNKLMMYSTGKVVEALSHINCWQGVTIELEILELGLRNRQLDTIAFFLKTKCEEFENLWKSLELDSNDDLIEVKIDCWERIFSLIKTSLKGNSKDISSRQFSEQLLLVTIQGLVQLINIVSIKLPSPKFLPGKVQNVSQMFCNLLGEVRGFLEYKTAPQIPVEDVTFHSMLIQTWKGLPEKEIIEDAVIRNAIPLAQWFLDSEYSRCLTLEDARRVSHEVALKFLAEDQINKAISVLFNAGLSPNEKLWDFFELTLEKGLRKILLPYIEKNGLMKEDDREALELIQVVQNIYPCSSFQKASQHQIEAAQSTDACPYPTGSPSNKESPISFEPRMDSTEDVFGSDEENFENFGYIRLSIQLLREMPPDLKERLMVEPLLQGKLPQTSSIKPSPLAIWLHLLLSNDLERLQYWIDECFGQRTIINNKQFPFGQIIDPSMVDSVDDSWATSLTKELVLNHLARYGIMCSRELRSFDLILKRLGCIESVLRDPHPFSLESASMDLLQFEHQLVHHCLQHQMWNVLVFYLKDGARRSRLQTCSDCRVPVMMAIVDLCSWADDRSDKAKFLKFILSSAQLTYDPASSSLSDLVIRASPLISTTILLYWDHADEEWNEAKRHLESAVSTFPVVHRVLYQGWPNVKQDITMYHLLSNATMFDMSKLFGWQKSNTIASEEAIMEMPHFSSPYLVKTYGLNQSIDIAYYLYEGRPNYAYLKFFSQELLSKKSVSQLRIQQASADVTQLALQNFTTPKVWTACVVFLELLGQDSLKLRIDLQVLQLIQNQKEESSQAAFKGDRQLVSEMISAQMSAESSQLIAEKLDPVIANILNSKRSQTSQYYLYLLFTAFCQNHQISMVPSFLIHFANKNDWFMLLVLADILMIPREQLIEVVKSIPDQCLVDHLTTALQNPLPRRSPVVRKESRVVRPKFVKEQNHARSLYYSQIGLGKDKSPSPASGGEVSEEEKVASDDGTTSSLEDAISLESLECVVQPEELFEQLSIASKSPNPGMCLLKAAALNRNPVLTLIAGSLTNDVSNLSCLCTWIVSTLSLKEDSSINGDWEASGFLWTPESFSQLICAIAKTGKHFDFLERALFYFAHTSPIYSLAKFLNQFWEKKMYDDSLEYLRDFQIKLGNLQKTSNTNLCSKSVLEDLAIEMVTISIIASSCFVELQLFLKDLSETGFQNIFPKEKKVPDFVKLASLLECLEDSDMCELPKESLLLPIKDPTFVRAAASVICHLQEKKFFSRAKQFGLLAGFSKEDILSSQLNGEATNLGAEFGERKEFWRRCDEQFRTDEINPAIASSFFKNWSHAASTPLERLQILVYTFKWSQLAGVQDLLEWEIKMWQCCIQCEALSEADCGILFRSVVSGLGSGVLEAWELDSTHKNSRSPLELRNDDEKLALDRIMFNLLDQSFVSQAKKLSSHFGHCCLELKAILSCLDLAKGAIKIDDLDPQVFSIVEDYCNTDNAKLEELNISDVIQAIHCGLSHGKTPCFRIMTHYKVSKLLWTQYTNVASEQDNSRLLLNILNCSNVDKYSVAKDLITVRRISDSTVISCLYRKVTDSLRKHSTFVDSRPPAREASNEQVVSDVAFQLLLNICSDPAKLGAKLLRDVDISKDTDHTYHIALCTSSHNCFSSCCNMEGISRVLQKCRQLTVRLAELQQFELMVSLLTGIGRYGEMTYIFDLLKENGQFELLLKKGMGKFPSLRLAMLDYLKRYHADDREMHSMALLHFKMFQDIAKMLESSAREKLIKIARLKGKSDLGYHLGIILQDLEAAAKSYIEADCLEHGQKCCRQAELVALQIYLLPMDFWILGLDSQQACNFIIEHKRFLEVQIVASAYQQQQVWDQALLHNVVQRGDWDYFRDFQAHIGLTPNLIASVARRYFLAKIKDERQEGNMKRLLNQCSDVVVRYQIANQLGFSDLTLELLKGDAGPYLQDFIEQKTNPQDWILSSI